jgi:hypothetical protein
MRRQGSPSREDLLDKIDRLVALHYTDARVASDEVISSLIVQAGPVAKTKLYEACLAGEILAYRLEMLFECVTRLEDYNVLVADDVLRSNEQEGQHCPEDMLGFKRSQSTLRRYIDWRCCGEPFHR